jgi:hypothetical protein
LPEVFNVTDMIFDRKQLRGERLNYRDVVQMTDAVCLLDSVKPSAVEFQTLVDAKSGERTSRAAQIVQGVTGMTLYRAKSYTSAVRELESCFPVAVDCAVPDLVEKLCSITAAPSGGGGEGAQTEERSEDELPWSHSISKLLPVPTVADKWEFRYKCHVVCAKACLAVALAEGQVKGNVTYDKAADHIYTGRTGSRRIGVCVRVCVRVCVCISYERAGVHT